MYGKQSNVHHQGEENFCHLLPIKMKIVDRNIFKNIKCKMQMQNLIHKFDEWWNAP